MRKIGTIVAAILLLTSGRRTTTDFPPPESGTEVKVVNKTITKTFYWDQPPEEGVKGYYFYVGTKESRNYIKKYDTQLTTNISIELDLNKTYFFTLTAYDIFKVESDYSSELAYTTSSHNPPKILKYEIYDNNDVYFLIDAILYVGIEFYASSDLRSWEYLGTFFNNWNQFVVHDNLANQGMRFYKFQISN